MSEEAKIVGVKKADAQLIADDAEKDLAAAKPELEAAKTAVAQLNKDSIIEIKSILHSIYEVAEQRDTKDAVVECMTCSDQDIVTVHQCCYHDDLSENEQHKGEYDVSYHYRIAAELQVVSHPNHDRKEDHGHRHYPKKGSH